MRKFYKSKKINPFDQRLWDKYQKQLRLQWEDAGLKVEEINFKKDDSVIPNLQAPHSGSVILDTRGTRLSFFMHVTLLNIPTYHQNIFFSNTQPSSKATWKYKNIKNRGCTGHGYMSFAYQRRYSLNELS